MTKQSKKSIEQFFNIAKALSHEVMQLPDSEMLNEANDHLTREEGVMAKRAYLKALQTVSAKEAKRAEPKAQGFNLVNALMKGMSVNVARQTLMGLTVSNDPSLQLVANRAKGLTDEEVLQTYQKLLASGVIKPDS